MGDRVRGELGDDRGGGVGGRRCRTGRPTRRAGGAASSRARRAPRRVELNRWENTRTVTGAWGRVGAGMPFTVALSRAGMARPTPRTDESAYAHAGWTVRVTGNVSYEGLLGRIVRASAHAHRRWPDMAGSNTVGTGNGEPDSSDSLKAFGAVVKVFRERAGLHAGGTGPAGPVLTADRRLGRAGPPASAAADFDRAGGGGPGRVRRAAGGGAASVAAAGAGVVVPAVGGAGGGGDQPLTRTSAG